MVRQPSRAVKGRGGKWFRLPRPKHPTQPDNHNPNSREGDGEQDVDYESCSEEEDAQFIAVVVGEAHSAVKLLDDAGHGEAAANVNEVCRLLLLYKAAYEESKVQHDKMHEKMKTACHERRVAQRKMQNVQGQSLRYWWKYQNANRQMWDERIRRWGHRGFARHSRPP